MKQAPTSIAIIMDGNRRFAKKNNLPTSEGHKKGAEKIQEVCNFAKEYNITTLTLFAFSSENWNREQEEITSLNNLLKNFLKTETVKFIEQKIKVQIIGNLDVYDEDIKNDIKNLEQATQSFKGFTLVIALNYGGRAEIVRAFNLLKNKEEITEDDISANLYTHNLPNPDLLIRTGGAIRLSNFLLWQMAYTELYFCNVLWPEFNKEEFKKALNFFTAQERNFGK